MGIETTNVVEGDCRLRRSYKTTEQPHVTSLDMVEPTSSSEAHGLKHNLSTHSSASLQGTNEQVAVLQHVSSNLAESFFDFTELPLSLHFESGMCKDSGSLSDPSTAVEDGEDQTGDELSKLMDEYDHLDLGEIDEGLRKPVQRLLEHLLQQQQKPIKIKRRHKVAFILGSANMWLTAYWLGKYPQTFYIFYTYWCVVLFSLRWVFYRMKKWHYYMLDFCYFANILLVATQNYAPTNIKLLKMSFAYSLGPLAWSILTFRNSLVYHSLDKMTSLFLHAYPACSIWVARWYPSPQMRALLEKDPQWQASWENATFWEMVFLPMLPYLLWAVLYYCKIFIVSSHRIATRGYETLFNYVKAHPTFYGKMIESAPQMYQPLVYMAMHLLMTAGTMMMCMLWWSSFWSNVVFMMVMGLVAASNGANYYFEVFAYRYVSGLDGSRAVQSGKEEHLKEG